MYIDATRPTPPNGSFPGAPNRAIVVKFFVPAVDGKMSRRGAPYPTMLFSHGASTTPYTYEYLLDAFVRAGFLVIAPVYPLSTTLAPGGFTPIDVDQQPGDASFVLDQVLAANRDPKSWLHGLINPKRIGTAGHSLGAMTTYGLVYNECCRDPRIKAAAVLSGATVVLPGQTREFPANEFFTGIHTPLLAVHGDQDLTVPYAAGLASWSKANAPKFFLTRVGGNHISDETGGSAPGQKLVTRALIDFFRRYLNQSPDALGDLKQDGNQAGVTSLTADP
jgi:dienelactone hydrolase